MKKTKRKNSEIISDFIRLFTTVEKRYEAVKNAVHTEEELTQDLLHSIELEGSKAKDRNKYATALRINRKDRRYYKDILEEIEPIHVFLEDAANKKAFNNLTRVLGEMRKAEGYHASRTYKPRVNRLEEETE